MRTVDTEPDNTDTPARAGDRAKPGATKTPRGVPAELDPPTGASGSGGLASGKLPSGATGSAAARPSSAPDALAAALIEAIDGFQPVDEPDADRFLNIAAAAQIQPDPIEELALLETRGFEGGWTRAFLSDTNDVAVASVYQFEDAAEAEFYLEDGLITIGGYGGKFFDVDGQPGVRGFIQYFTENDPSGREELVSLGAAFQAGPRWYLVYFVGSVDTVTPALLIPTIAAQRRTANG